MSNRNKAKGSAFVASLIPALQAVWPAAEARAQHGAFDRGDIVNTDDWTIECKREKRINLSGYLKEARAEAVNAGTDYYCAIVKRRGTTDPLNQYVVMDLRTFLGALS